MDEQQEGGLVDKRKEPKGVIPKNLQAWVVVGIGLLILIPLFLSGGSAGTKKAAKKAEAQGVEDAKGDDLTARLAAQQAELQRLQGSGGESSEIQAEMSPSPTPGFNIQDPEILLEKERLQRQQQLLQQQAACPTCGIGDQYSSGGGGYGGGGNGYVDAAREQRSQRDYQSLFSSSVAKSSRAGVMPPPAPTPRSIEQELLSEANDPAPAMAAEPEPKPVAPPAARSARARVSDSDELARSRTSKRYMIFEGTVLESVLLTRINSDFTGPVVAMTSADIYSRDRQELLIPAGTKVVGEARRTAAFGESRVAVVFHRLLMTDGYSVNLDQFTGLSAKGETALKDQVNNHYFKIFGASIAVGAIGGLSAYGTNTAGMAGQSAADTYRQGVAGELGAASRNILERFLNIMPTITIREGHRMRIYITQDMRLPAYRDHDMPSDL